MNCLNVRKVENSRVKERLRTKILKFDRFKTTKRRRSTGAKEQQQQHHKVWDRGGSKLLKTYDQEVIILFFYRGSLMQEHLAHLDKLNVDQTMRS